MGNVQLSINQSVDPTQFSSPLLHGPGQEFVFPAGLIGFPSYQRFLLNRHHQDDGRRSPFFLLCSQNGEPDGALTFPLISPHILLTDYRLAPSPDILARLGVGSVSDVIVLTIATLHERPEESTANLQGPLLFSPTRHVGLQLVEERYPARYPLMERGALGTDAWTEPPCSVRC